MSHIKKEILILLTYQIKRQERLAVHQIEIKFDKKHIKK